jgi:post-segregation antitoxin (ccd killing protein)
MGRLKKKVYINLPPELVEKARKHGLNISKVCENALVEIMNRIEGSENKENPVSSVNASSQEGLVVRLPEFESGLEAWKASVLDQARPQPHSPNWKDPDIL